MKNRITVFNKDIPEIGLYSRKITIGAECTLVKQFIEYYSDCFLRKSKVHNLAVFIEPRIISGFPDIVFACYNPKMLDNWPSERLNINHHDLKILSYFVNNRGQNGSEIISALRISEKQILSSLEKLLDAKMILRKNKGWYLRPLKDIYGIKKLISVEAKVNNLKRVVEQSFINTWFASQSYVLTNVASPQPETIQNINKYGIGMYCKTEKFKKVIEAKEFMLPSNYISFQFNEWIGNSLNSAGGLCKNAKFC